MISVVGIGFESGDITARGKKAIKQADVVVSRGKHRSADVVFCQLFPDCESYSELDGKIAEYVLALHAEGKSVAFLSVGDGYSDTAVKLIAESAAVTVIPGVADTRARELGSTYATYSAYDVNELTVFDSSMPTVIYQIDDRFVAGDLKLSLLRFYGAETEISLCNGGEVSRIALEDLGRQAVKQGSSIYIKGECDFTGKTRYGFNDLVAIVRALTAPDGCPWDKEQTHDSIRIDLLEEAYEAVDAISRGDIDDSVEELGDVMLQSVFHSDIASREGEYDIYDVITGLCVKLVSRHTHIFGENKASSSDQALFYWEKAKSVEKSYTSFKDQIERLPENFPGALLIHKFIKKANKNGAGITAERLLEKMRSYVVLGGKQSELLACAVMYCALSGVDSEVALLDKFRQLKEASDGENLGAEIDKLI